MKMRRLLLVSLALVAVMMLTLSGVALAAKLVKFTGQGWLQITYMPDPIPLGPNLLLFQDEVVVGGITNSDGFPALVGAELYSVHTTLAKVDWSTWDMKGIMIGTFTLTTPDGDIVKGTMSAKQEGNLLGGDIVSKGAWTATERTGVFKQMLPQGKWEATVGVDGSGTLTWEGALLVKE